jgi:hypothetical protein
MARANKRGPRTAAGKIRSSLNALRHGLAATHRRQALPMQAIERLADAICGDGPDRADGALLAAARGIAENAFVLSTIRQQKIVVIERLKEATKIALRKGDNSFTLAKARFMEAWLAYREIQKLVPPALKKFEGQMLPPMPGVDWRDGTDDIVPIRLKALLEEPTQEDEERALQLARAEIRRQERNDHEALEEAIPDLIRLERYERRAWSRHKRAIREFGLIKFHQRYVAGRQLSAIS